MGSGGVFSSTKGGRQRDLENHIRDDPRLATLSRESGSGWPSLRRRRLYCWRLPFPWGNAGQPALRWLCNLFSRYPPADDLQLRRRNCGCWSRGCSVIQVYIPEVWISRGPMSINCRCSGHSAFSTSDGDSVVFGPD
ncbi:hypothetical protein TSAR_002340 [Trichomalopsis sarcophagae]|uniref:Uncharacterized protein n=1 Tax=Trichomalopsis sarcophagae TaxID=543379 RepID=A0A232EKH9_9HYME|nr:hypothetical protein TSAR_002340 [Trichomalopsis sarcophagae]